LFKKINSSRGKKKRKKKGGHCGAQSTAKKRKPGREPGVEVIWSYNSQTKVGGEKETNIIGKGETEPLPSDRQLLRDITRGTAREEFTENRLQGKRSPVVFYGHWLRGGGREGPLKKTGKRPVMRAKGGSIRQSCARGEGKAVRGKPTSSKRKSVKTGFAQVAKQAQDL